MNAQTFPRALLPLASDDQDYGSACAVLADRHLGHALDLLADKVGDICGQRRVLTDAEHKALVGIRNAMVSVSHARNLLGPLMLGRLQ